MFFGGKMGGEIVKSSVKQSKYIIPKYSKDILQLMKTNMTDNRTLERLINDYPRLKDFLKEVPRGGSILDLGYGKGVAINKIAKEYPVNAIGVDIRGYDDSKSPDNLFFLEGNLEDGIPVEDNSTDLIYSFYVFQYLKNNLKLLNDVYQKLKVGGKAIINIGLGQRFDQDLLDDIINNNEFENLVLTKNYKKFETKDGSKKTFVLLFIELNKTEDCKKIVIPYYSCKRGFCIKDEKGSPIDIKNNKFFYRYSKGEQMELHLPN